MKVVTSNENSSFSSLLLLRPWTLGRVENIEIENKSMG